MKKLLILSCILLLVTSCAPKAMPVEAPSSQASAQSEVAQSSTSSSMVSSEPQEVLPSVYKATKSMSPEETVEAYIEQVYSGYANLSYIDVSEIVEMRFQGNKNMINWIKLMMQRRRLLKDESLCYVETQRYPYSITFEDAPVDERMGPWIDWLKDPKNTVVHFRIIGEEGKAYPPMLAVNSQHSMLLSKVDGMWKIALHFFPGSNRKFTQAGIIEMQSESQTLADLRREFANASIIHDPNMPKDAETYDYERAVEYAKKYAETKNPEFYDVGDMTGNCANFVSQAVWYGFGGESMSNEWQGNSSGTLAWENVNHFWDYINSKKELGGTPVNGVTSMNEGDVLQIRTATLTDERERFTHTMILVDKDKMIFAQNTPASFVYYSDIVNVETRIIRPTYFVAGE